MTDAKTTPDKDPLPKTAPQVQTPKQRKDESERLDEGLEETFPASDPVSAKHIT